MESKTTRIVVALIVLPCLALPFIAPPNGVSFARYLTMSEADRKRYDAAKTAEAANYRPAVDSRGVMVPVAEYLGSTEYIDVGEVFGYGGGYAQNIRHRKGGRLAWATYVVKGGVVVAVKSKG